MKRSVFTIAFLLFVLSISFSQPCLPEGITFTSQEQIDNFQIDHPGCTQIVGAVTINGNDITDLSELSVITSVGSDLAIDWCAILPNLSGLNNLDSVGGNVDFINNFNLTTISDLENLTYVGGDIKFYRNSILTDLYGLDMLTTIDGYLTVYDNNYLLNMNGLNALSSISGSMYIFANGSLSNFEGFNNLMTIGGTVEISDNPDLENLSGLSNLTSIGESLYIANNEELTSLHDLENINSIGGELRIYNHDYLTSLEGLENIDAGTISHLFIIGNTTLSTCEVKSICDYLAAPNGITEIGNNKPGCNSQEEVKEACELVSVTKINLSDKISISPNPANNHLTISVDESIAINDVKIYNPSGQCVFHDKPVNNSIGISNLLPGIYIIELVSDQRKIRKKLIVK